MGGGENPFWDFSLAVYGRSGVAEACLALQDEAGLDVNILLFCCFAGSRRRRLDARAAGRLAAETADWQRCAVRPLREVRRWLKHADGADAARRAALRQAVKDQELQAERIEQDLLFARLGEAAAATDAAPMELAAANLAAYLEASGLAPDGGHGRALAALLCGAFPDILLSEAERLLPG